MRNIFVKKFKLKPYKKHDIERFSRKPGFEVMLPKWLYLLIFKTYFFLLLRVYRTDLALHFGIRISIKILCANLRIGLTRSKSWFFLKIDFFDKFLWIFTPWCLYKTRCTKVVPKIETRKFCLKTFVYMPNIMILQEKKF